MYGNGRKKWVNGAGVSEMVRVGYGGWVGRVGGGGVVVVGQGGLRKWINRVGGGRWRSNSVGHGGWVGGLGLGWVSDWWARVGDADGCQEGGCF